MINLQDDAISLQNFNSNNLNLSSANLNNESRLSQFKKLKDAVSTAKSM